MKDQILALLSSDYPWADRYFWFPSLDSTNDQLKDLARQGALHGTVIMAGHQYNGHGRMGRSFQSPENMGVYMSILLRPQCTPAELMHLTCAAAVTVCDAVEAAVGIRPGIKWTNDLVFQRRKLGGILTELGLNSQGMVDYAIIGIGINCCQQAGDFPPELREMAASLSMVSGKPISPAALAAAMMEALWDMDSSLLTQKAALMAAYKKDCITLGREISLVRGPEIRHGKALDLDENGALIVAFSDGHTEAVNSGEVSVRGMYGYI